MQHKIQEAASWLKNFTPMRPTIGLILGTGLGRLAEEIEVIQEIGYDQIPHFPISTVEGHSGRLIFGRLGGKDIIAMRGRMHYYEGYDMKSVTLPIRVMSELGVKTLFVSNAAGGMNPAHEIGALMFITDHINLFPEHPLRGANIPPGPRFLDMSDPYSKPLLQLGRDIADELNIKHTEGVYIGVQGPTFETPAEYRMYRLLGGDAVGMSTVPEVIVARHCDMAVFGVSVITDLGVEGKIVEVTHEEIQKAADEVQPSLGAIIRTMIERM